MQQKGIASSINKSQGKLRVVNNILSLIICILCLYVIIAPVIPTISSYWYNKMDQSKGLKYKGQLAKQSGIDSSKLQPTPKVNTIVIPSIGIDGEIIVSPDSSSLDRGIWHRPNTSTPDKGGNTVVAAHRFQYTSGPKTFYNLNKLKVGDKITVFWYDSKNIGYEYIYEVNKSFIVPPTAVEIENQTSKENILTLFTCTPLWTAKDRLVVTAKLLDKYEINKNNT
jgi:sortase A